jgi:hypothetical protein
MRKLVLIAAATAALLVTLVPGVRAASAEVRFRTPDGRRWSAAISDAGLLETCVDRRSPPSNALFRRVEIIAGETRRSTELALVPGSVYLRQTNGDWCRVPPAVGDALGGARRLPPPRGPWLALIFSLGGIAFAVAVIALWGAGTGPQPTVGEASESQTHH